MIIYLAIVGCTASDYFHILGAFSLKALAKAEVAKFELSDKQSIYFAYVWEYTVNEHYPVEGLDVVRCPECEGDKIVNSEQYPGDLHCNTCLTVWSPG